MANGNTPAPATLVLATCNTLNLANPGRLFYANQEPFGADEYARKVEWLGGMLRRLNADILAFQEVWDEAALRDAVAASGLRYPQVVAVPELGEHRALERPVLEALIEMPGGRGTLRALIVHLKSKRPKLLLNEAGEVIEDRDDPAIVSRATLHSSTPPTCRATPRSGATWPTRTCTRAGPRCWTRSGSRRSSLHRAASRSVTCGASSTSTTTCTRAARASVPTMASCAHSFFCAETTLGFPGLLRPRAAARVVPSTFRMTIDLPWRHAP